MQRNLLALALAAVLAAGCAAGGTASHRSDGPDDRGKAAVTADAPGPGADKVGQAPSQAQAGPTATPERRQVAPALAVERPRDAVERVFYESTLEIPGPGYYVVDLESGRVETWRPRREAAEETYVHLSDDRRWIVLWNWSGERTWVNRESGDAFSWKDDELHLLAAGPDRFLFLAVQDGKGPLTFHVTDGQFRLQQTFTVALGGKGAAEAAFSPDGAQVVLATSRWGTLDPAADVRIYLVDLASLQVRDLGAPPEPAEGRVWGVRPIPTEEALIAHYSVSVQEPWGESRTESIIRRYAWDGALLAEFAVPGQVVGVSPDGRLIASGTELYNLVGTTFVTDAATGQPLFRVLNAGSVQWTADSAGLLLQVPMGDRAFLVSREGELREAPAIPGGGWPPVWEARLVPAPDDPDRFLAGLSIVDGAGNVLHTIALPEGDWKVLNPQWGASGREVILEIYLPSGKGNLGNPLPLPTVVQKPPFPDPYLLIVQDPEEGCVNLRQDPSLRGAVIRCLPGGTRLAVADLSTAPRKMLWARDWRDGHMWAWVRTQAGETGWVSLSTGSVMWVE